MNKGDLKSLEGTEFTYIFEDGDTIRAYVKKANPEIGVTCMSLETETTMGWKPSDLEEDGTFCVMGYNFIDGQSKPKEVWNKLKRIPKTGTYKVDSSTGGGTFSGCAF